MLKVTIMGAGHFVQMDEGGGGFATGEEDGKDEAVFLGEGADEVDFTRDAELTAEGGDLVGGREDFERRQRGFVGGASRA